MVMLQANALANAFGFFVSGKENKFNPWVQSSETFYGRNLQIFIVN